MMRAAFIGRSKCRNHRTAKAIDQRTIDAGDESWNATCGDDPEEACEALQKLGPKVTRQETIELYGYFKQSLWGDAPEGGADTRLGALHVAKFNSWAKLRGMTKEAAQQEYVKRADEIVVREGGTLLSR